jgi:DNA-binding transcriptional MerR regulator
MGESRQKLYYSISEVAELTGVKAHVLRYWESEFPTLRPSKARSGSRRYRLSDIEEIRAIKDLLYEEGFKIAGARKVRRDAHRRRRELEEREINQISLDFAGLDRDAQLDVVRSEAAEILELVRSLAAPGVGGDGRSGPNAGGSSDETADGSSADEARTPLRAREADA